jgi:peroxiredoxin
MAPKENSVIKGWPVYLVFLVLIGAVVWALKNQPSGSAFEGTGSTAFHPADVHVHEADVSGEPKSMAQIISARRTWKPVWTNSYGQMAADLELKDIFGKTHKLSDYRGKNVLLIFWATWCPPCLTEIPHLIELRNRISEDELAMLAISDEGPTMLQRFAESKKLNYTVISSRGPFPAPFGGVRGIPAGFVIDKEGKIKLATEGLVSLTELLQILRAEN